MRRLSFQMMVCLTLATLLAVPTVLAADGQIYADGTCSVGARPNADGSTPANAICVGSPPDFAPAIEKLPNKTGTIVYIFSGGYCQFLVQNGDPGAPTSCSQGAPPGTGAPFAPALLWGVIGLVAIVLVTAGLLFRRHGAASG